MVCNEHLLQTVYKSKTQDVFTLSDFSQKLSSMHIQLWFLIAKALPVSPSSLILLMYIYLVMTLYTLISPPIDFVIGAIRIPRRGIQFHKHLKSSDGLLMSFLLAGSMRIYFSGNILCCSIYNSWIFHKLS